MLPVTIYSTTWCGHCRRLKRQLDEAGIRYDEIDIDEHEQYADLIAAATGGYRTVPTLQVGRHLLVNPTVSQVQAALLPAPAN
jgi:mycoredoxin